MSSDPYHHLPDLAGQAGKIEDVRQGDPSRVFPSLRGGITDAVTGRILDVPRCKVYRGTDLILAAATPTGVVWPSVEYDTDGISTGASASALLTIKVPGLYMVACTVEYPQTGAAVYTRIIKNNNAALQLAQDTRFALAGIDPVITLCAPAVFKAGDQFSLLLYSAGATTIVVHDINTLWLACCLISSFGSDNG